MFDISKGFCQVKKNLRKTRKWVGGSSPNSDFNFVLEILCFSVFLWVGPLATATLLWLSKHNFGTKSDVTSFIKPVDRSISFMKRPFAGVASNFPDTMSIFTRFQTDCMDF